MVGGCAAIDSPRSMEVIVDRAKVAAEGSARPCPAIVIMVV